MQEIKIMRILREANGYSQEYVASQLEIEQNTYSKLESGQIKLTVDRMKKLSKLYSVTPDFFLTEDLPIVNYNSGKYSKGIVNTEIYNEGSDLKFPKSVFNKLLDEKEKVIIEKNKQIEYLKKEIQIFKKERQQFLKLIEKMTK